MLLRSLIFLALEGVLAQHLWKGLSKSEFALLSRSIAKRSQRPIRYWAYAIAILAAMVGLAWSAWEIFGWRYMIIVACARDLSFCP